MNILNELQIDALAEVFNVGAGRAAASLSEIVNDEVHLSVPSIEVKKTLDVDASLVEVRSDKFGVVSQFFSGPFDAQALLLFSEMNTLEIVRDMMGSQMSVEEIAEFEQEAMCELGNIILNACLSAMADMLQVTLHCSLPNYKISSTGEIVKGLRNAHDEPYLIVLHIDLAIEKKQSEGRLIFLLSSMSLNSLIEHIERFLGHI